MTNDNPSIASTVRTSWQILVRHMPGFIVGLYFLAAHFLATFDRAYLLLVLGTIVLLLTQPKLAWRRLIGLPTVLAIGLLASTLLSIHMTAQTGIDSRLSVSLIPGLLVYAIVVLCVREPRQLLGILGGVYIALAASLWLFATASLHSEFSRTVQLIYFGAQPLFLAANDMLMYVIFLPLVLWFALHEWRGRTGAALAAGYVALLVLLAVLLLSRMSLLLVAAYCFLLFNAGRGRRLWYAAALAGVLAAVALMFDASLLKKLETLDFSRLRTWLAALAMFADAPWFGNGPGSFSLLYPAYWQGMPEAIRLGSDVRDIGWAHSLFFEAAAEKGVVGLSAIVGYFVYLFAAMRHRSRTGRSRFAGALYATVAILFVVSVFELSLLRVWGIYVICLLLALVAVFDDDARSSATLQNAG